MATKERKEKQEKPLDKMTATELRKYALELGEISGVHGMNKAELLSAIKKVKGVREEGKAAGKPEVREELSARGWKEKAKEARNKKLEARAAGASRKQIDILRKKANRLKKRSRRAA